MPSERGNEKALWKWANHLHRAFLLLLHIFCVRRKCSRRRRKASRRAWWLLHCKPSGRTVLCEAGIPMRKSGEKPYLEGIASAPSTGPHGINGGSGNRAVLQTGERPFLILLKKVRKGPPKQSKAGVLHHAGFCMDSFCFLDGVFPKRRCSCAFAEVASASALAERSTLRGGRRAGLHGGRLFFGKRRYSSRAVFRFSFLFWAPRASSLGRFRMRGAPHFSARLGKGGKK